MSRIIWDDTGDRLFETGTKQGVLYPEVNGAYPNGYGWNGLTAVTESPSGAEATPLYANDSKYLNLYSNEELGGTIEAYTYPDEFGQCDGSANLGGINGIKIGQQARKAFGFCYKTVLGNDELGNDYGYKLHIIYGAKASPSERAYATVNDSPEAITFSWEFTTTPVNVPGGKPTSSITIDSTKVSASKLKDLEDILYGTATADPRLPLPSEIATIMSGSATYYPLTLIAGNVTIYDNYNDEDIDIANAPKTVNTNDGLDWLVKPASGASSTLSVTVMKNGVDVTSSVVTTDDDGKNIIIQSSGLNGPVAIMASAS